MGDKQAVTSSLTGVTVPGCRKAAFLQVLKRQKSGLVSANHDLLDFSGHFRHYNKQP